jgi:hypothetical protein
MSLPKHVVITDLEHYPKNGKFLRLLGACIPVHITKGEDVFRRQRHLWATYPDDSASYSFREFFWKNIKSKERDHAKMFKTPERALKFAAQTYKKYLLNELKKLEENDKTNSARQEA